MDNTSLTRSISRQISHPSHRWKLFEMTLFARVSVGRAGATFSTINPDLNSPVFKFIKSLNIQIGPVEILVGVKFA